MTQRLAIAATVVAFLALQSAVSAAHADPAPFALYGETYEYGGPALAGEGMGQSFSGDGAYTVFESDELLTPDATGNQRHVYRRTVADGTLTLVSKRVRTDPPLGSSYNASISADGNWVAFETTDAGVFSADPSPKGSIQIALVDMSTGAVTRVSTPRGADPSVASGVNKNAMVSADGNHVVFTSNQSGMNNKGAPTSSYLTIEKFDRATGDITNVSGGVNPATGAAEAVNGTNDQSVISADGRFIAYTSAATNLGVAATAFPAPTPTPSPTPTSSPAPSPSPTPTPSPTPSPTPGPTPPPSPSPSELTEATFADLVDPAPFSFVYRWDTQSLTSALVSASSSDSGTDLTKTDGDSYLPTISADGDKVGFISGATNLLGESDWKKTPSHMTDAYVRTLTTAPGVTHRVSMALLDYADTASPDSHGFDPSVTRVRRWAEPWVSTTRISLAADGMSAVLTSMSPLLEIHGKCVTCQTFRDGNNALDVYQVRLTGDARPEYVQPISLKRNNQDTDRKIDFVRESTTGGGDSIADGKTPTTADGSQVAFSSQAQDLRGWREITLIQAGGPPNYLTPAWLPDYVDGGKPDSIKEFPIRMFTVAANAFNPHLHVDPARQATIAEHPAETAPIEYETRTQPLPTLPGAVIQSTATSFLVGTSIVPGAKTVVYGLTIHADTTGSVEVVLDLDQFVLAKEASIPAYWVRAKDDAPNTLTYTNTLMRAGDFAVFSLQLNNTNTHLNASKASVTASINGPYSTTKATIDIKPLSPKCTTPTAPFTAIAGAATAVGAEIQCIATVGTAMTAQADHGVVSLNSSGGITYTADADFRGKDTIRVVAVDGYSRASAPAAVTVDVVAPPIAVDDVYTTAANRPLGVPAAHGVLSNDTLPPGPVEWRVDQRKAPNDGELKLNAATGELAFDPAAGFVGDVTFTYTIGAVGSKVISKAATVVIHVTP